MKADRNQNRLVVGDATWADTIPEWLLDEIKNERMMYGLLRIIKPEKVPLVGYAELVAYLMTASMRAPLCSEHVNIYIWCCAKVFERKKKEMTDDMKEMLKRGLTQGEEYYYKELQRNIYSARGGEIKHPLLDVMRQLKKKCDREMKKKLTDHTRNNESGEVQMALFTNKEGQ